MMILYKFVWDLSLARLISFFSYQTQYKKLENDFSTSKKGNIQSVMMRNFESNFNALILRIPIPSQSSYAFFHFENMCGFCSLYHHLGFYCMYYWTYFFHDEKSWILKLGLLLNCTEKSLLNVSYDFVFLFSIWYKWLHYKYLSTWT